MKATLKTQLKDLWRFTANTCVIVFLIMLVLKTLPLPVPLFDKGGVTLVMPTRASQEAVAIGLGAVVGGPDWTLDTHDVARYLFRDGTSIDWLPVDPQFKQMYRIVALKTEVIDPISCIFTSPMKKAQKLRRELEAAGWQVQVVELPDRAFDKGSVVLILSDAFMYKCPTDSSASARFGAAILIRKYGPLTGGPSPKRFKGF